MILPNKLIRFQDSVIAKMVYILDEIKLENQSIDILYEKIKDHFDDVNQYILTLDVLYILGKLKVDEKARVILYVKANNM